MKQNRIKGNQKRLVRADRERSLRSGDPSIKNIFCGIRDVLRPSFFIRVIWRIKKKDGSSKEGEVTLRGN